MNICNSVDWDVDRSVGAKVGRVNNGGIESDIDAKSGSSNGEGVG